MLALRQKRLHTEYMDKMPFLHWMQMTGGTGPGYPIAPEISGPQTYDELIEFMGHQFGLEADISREGLSRWIAQNASADAVDHLRTVVLISDLPDPDQFVGSIPESDDRKIYLPSLSFIQERIGR